MQLRQQVAELRAANFALNDEAKTMRAERDEARRMYCLGFTDFCPNPAHAHLGLVDAAAEVAKSFGWDCFKEKP